ncbi:MAG: hypothetical protein K0S33_665 [Bacteroidetes bacterium]|jgi:hypothetical protein|nr:hypothetical protein [Bacteroidota bacterium]
MSQPTFITNDTELHQRIMKLNYLKEEQELIIKRNVREIGYSLHPSVMLKNFISKFTDDSETNTSLKSLGLNIGKDFLLSKLFGKGQSFKGFLMSLVLRKVSDYVVNKHPELITNGIQKIQSFVSKHLTHSEHTNE